MKLVGARTGNCTEIMGTNRRSGAFSSFVDDKGGTTRSRGGGFSSYASGNRLAGPDLALPAAEELIAAAHARRPPVELNEAEVHAFLEELRNYTGGDVVQKAIASLRDRDWGAFRKREGMARLLATHWKELLRRHGFSIDAFGFSAMLAAVRAHAETPGVRIVSHEVERQLHFQPGALFGLVRDPKTGRDRANHRSCGGTPVGTRLATPRTPAMTSMATSGEDETVVVTVRHVQCETPGQSEIQVTVPSSATMRQIKQALASQLDAGEEFMQDGHFVRSDHSAESGCVPVADGQRLGGKTSLLFAGAALIPKESKVSQTRDHKMFLGETKDILNAFKEAVENPDIQRVLEKLKNEGGKKFDQGRKFLIAQEFNPVMRRFDFPVSEAGYADMRAGVKAFDSNPYIRQLAHQVEHLCKVDIGSYFGVPVESDLKVENNPANEKFTASTASVSAEHTPQTTTDHQGILPSQDAGVDEGCVKVESLLLSDEPVPSEAARNNSNEPDCNAVLSVDAEDDAGSQTDCDSIESFDAENEKPDPVANSENEKTKAATHIESEKLDPAVNEKHEETQGATLNDLEPEIDQEDSVVDSPERDATSSSLVARSEIPDNASEQTRASSRNDDPLIDCPANLEEPSVPHRSKESDVPAPTAPDDVDVVVRHVRKDVEVVLTVSTCTTMLEIRRMLAVRLGTKNEGCLRVGNVNDSQFVAFQDARVLNDLRKLWVVGVRGTSEQISSATRSEPEGGPGTTSKGGVLVAGVFEVVHQRVAIRASPSTAGQLLGALSRGDLVSGTTSEMSSGPWLKLDVDSRTRHLAAGAGNDAWVLVHGSAVGLGELLRAKRIPVEPPALKEGIVEVLILHGQKAGQFLIRVPESSTMADVKTALVQQLGRGHLDRVQIVRKTGGTFTNYRDSDTLGKIRELIAIGIALPVSN